jgi:hypothetical protein
MAIRRSLFATLSCIAIVAGCSSSTTTGKSPDDQVHELIAQAQSLSEEQRQVQGPGIAAQIKALRDKTSDATKKEIDTLMYSIARVQGDADKKLTPSVNTIDVSNSAPETIVPEGDSATKPASKGPELAPTPREVKK